MARSLLPKRGPAAERGGGGEGDAELAAYLARELL